MVVVARPLVDAVVVATSTLFPAQDPSTRINTTAENLGTFRIEPPSAPKDVPGCLSSIIQERTKENKGHPRIRTHRSPGPTRDIEHSVPSRTGR